MNGQRRQLLSTTNHMRSFSIKWYNFWREFLMYSSNSCFWFQAIGKATSSFTSECISTGVSEDVGETIVKSVAASLFAGGSDTVSVCYIPLIIIFNMQYIDVCDSGDILSCNGGKPECAEACTGRNRPYYRLRAFAYLFGSQESTVCRGRLEGNIQMGNSCDHL